MVITKRNGTTKKIHYYYGGLCRRSRSEGGDEAVGAAEEDFACAIPCNTAASISGGGFGSEAAGAFLLFCARARMRAIMIA